MLSYATRRTPRLLTSFTRSFHASRSLQAPAATLKVAVNGKEIEIPNGYTVLQACEEAGVLVPRFCFHDRLSIAGNCRMCLVEVEKSPKPVASCAMPAMPGMKIKTDTPIVKKAREGVMEFLLANHPLDCPICDQGGECDLQDQSLAYGSDKSRFREFKRGVEDKNIGPLVKTVMTRCIHCTRCIRYTTEICGIETMGLTGRGNQIEVGTYVTSTIDSEISGNVIDLCPVGALTSKPFAFTARAWELLRTQSVDVTDAVGAAIRIDTRGPEVMRILPRLNEDVNEEWISDKARFSYDGLKRQRLDTPLVKKNGQFTPVPWSEALTEIATELKKVKGEEILGVVGELVDAESLVTFKDFLNRLGSDNTITTQHATKLSADLRSDYLFNSTIAGLEQADAILLVGSNPRMESPLIAARIRKLVRNTGVNVFSVGPEADLAFPVTHLGNNTSLLKDIADGKSVADIFKKAKKPLVIIGLGALNRKDGEGVLHAVANLKKSFPALHTPEWNGINVLHTAASRVGALDLGFVPGPNALQTPAKFVYLLNAETFDRSLVAPNAFIVYQGHHGDAGADQASIVLPAPAYVEKAATYVNMEGRVQRTKAAVGRLVQAREDWAIFRALSEVVGSPLPYNTIDEVRQRLVEVSPTFATLDRVQSPSYTEPSYHTNRYAPALAGAFEPFINNFFFTDVIGRASKTMAKAVQQLPTATNSYKTAQTAAQSENKAKQSAAQ